MPTTPNFKFTSVILTIRWVQGYRYLDKTGEALILLEDRLDKGWITAEVTPASGTMKNYRLGMSATFQSASLQIRQDEFVSLDHFKEEASKLYDTLRDTFGIERLIAPTFYASLQHAALNTNDAEELLERLAFCTPSKKLQDWLGGKKTALALTMCTESLTTLGGIEVNRRQRFESNSLRQTRPQSFDPRLFSRPAVLTRREREATEALEETRRAPTKFPEFAVQVQLETTFESEFATAQFDFPGFLDINWNWASRIRTDLNGSHP